MEKKRICAECIHWKCGDFWGTCLGRHGVLVESQGWCMFKKDKNGNITKRKRWNYCTACPNFEKVKETGFIYQGGGGNSIEEDLANVTELMKELAENNIYVKCMNIMYALIVEIHSGTQANVKIVFLFKKNLFK